MQYLLSFGFGLCFVIGAVLGAIACIIVIGMLLKKDKSVEAKRWDKLYEMWDRAHEDSQELTKTIRDKVPVYIAPPSAPQYPTPYNYPPPHVMPPIITCANHSNNPKDAA